MSAAGLERPQLVSHVQQALSYTLFDCKWVPRSARLLCLGSAARGTGLLQLYELRGGRLALLREVSGGGGGAGAGGGRAASGGGAAAAACAQACPDPSAGTRAARPCPGAAAPARIPLGEGEPGACPRPAGLAGGEENETKTTTWGARLAR